MIFGPLPYGRAPDPCKVCGDPYCDTFQIVKIPDFGLGRWVEFETCDNMEET